jgi:uncharacterized protein YlxP (DUF503 family)
MWVLAARFDLHVPAAESLKDKRRALRPVIDGLRHRFNAGVSEVDGQDLWQRAGLGVALVGADVTVLERVLQDIERFVACHPALEILSTHEALYQTDDDE